MINVDNWILSLQLQDHKIAAIIEQLNGGIANKDLKNNFELFNGRLYRKTVAGKRLVVSSMGKWMLMRKFQDNLGPGEIIWKKGELMTKPVECASALGNIEDIQYCCLLQSIR